MSADLLATAATIRLATTDLIDALVADGRDVGLAASMGFDLAVDAADQARLVALATPVEVAPAPVVDPVAEPATEPATDLSDAGTGDAAPTPDDGEQPTGDPAAQPEPDDEASPQAGDPTPTEEQPPAPGDETAPAAPDDETTTPADEPAAEPIDVSGAPSA